MIDQMRREREESMERGAVVFCWGARDDVAVRMSGGGGGWLERDVGVVAPTGPSAAIHASQMRIIIVYGRRGLAFDLLNLYLSQVSGRDGVG